jgi:hypothetical protein
MTQCTQNDRERRTFNLEVIERIDLDRRERCVFSEARGIDLTCEQCLPRIPPPHSGETFRGAHR